MAGMASAIALARDGHQVTLVERFAEAKPHGAGLLLQPSGLAALDRLGLGEAARACGARVDGLDGRTRRGRVVMDLHYDGVAHGAYGLGIHRASLFSILHERLVASGVELRLNFDAAAIEDFARPRLLARDGKSEGPFDLLLDCAGAHDGLRASIAPRLRQRLYAWGALWTTCPDHSGAFQGALRQIYDGAAVMIGILPVGHVPGSTFDGPHVAFFWSLKLADHAAQREAGLDVLKQRVLTAWPAAALILAEIESFDRLALATYRDVVLSRYSRGRVLALGDAAHATSPELGQGANLALIDAVTLAHALRATARVEEALALYEKLRRPHLRYYQIASRMLTPAFQSDSRAMGWLRDAFLGPVSRLPGLSHVMRTTLAGQRCFPWGLWRMPD